MAKTRFTGKGGLVKILTGNTYNAVGLSRSITPPAQEKAVIDVTGMEDAAVEPAQGIEQLSQLVFEQIHDPADTQDALIDTLYGSGNTGSFQVVFVAGAKTLTGAFTGIVTAITPNAVTGNDAVTRTVTIQRKGAITWTNP